MQEGTCPWRGPPDQTQGLSVNVLREPEDGTLHCDGEGEAQCISVTMLKGPVLL